MSRKTIISIFACLLSLLPILTQAQSLTKYEYWFDDNFSGRKSGNLNGTNQLVNTSIATDGLDNGVHKFSFRARQSDGYYSAITSSLFLKRTAATSSQMEYWFDDNFDQRGSISIGNTEEEQELNLDLRDNTKFPMGFHKLNIRVTMEGKGESAIYSSPILKLSAGTAASLEYWIDDDIAHSRTIDGKLASDGKDYLFVTDLDLGNVTPGYHRLYCRAVSSSKRTSSAVTMTPIMVKSKYNEPSNLMVTECNIVVDNGESIDVPIVNQKEVVNIPYVFDARNLSLGEHNLKATVKNSMGAITTLEQPFTVTPPENPSITLSCYAFDEMVHVEYNSIPNDVNYVIMERSENGEEHAASFQVPSAYPEPLEGFVYPDDWGVYTYWVKATYLDRFGKEQTLTSNEVTLYNWSPRVENTYGCITGRIVFVDNQTNSLLSPHKRIFVNFSNNGETEKIPVNPNGTFYRDYIPFGTTFTMSIDDDDYYQYESITVTVDEKTRNNTYKINATARDDVAFGVSNEEYDLIATSFTWDADARTIDLDVKYKNKNDSWTGILEVIAYRKEGFKKDDKVFASTQPFYRVGSAYIKNLDGYHQQHISIEIENFPVLKKEEDYLFFFMTQRDDMSTTKQYCQLVFQDDYNYHNPMSLNMVPDPEIDNVDFSDIDEFIVAVFKVIKGLDKWSGPFSGAIEHLAKKLDKYDQNKDLTEFYYELPGLFVGLSEDVRTIWKNGKKEMKLGPIQTFYETAKDVVQFNDKEPFDQFLTVCKYVFDYSDIPFVKLYKLYLEAAEHAVDKIEEYQKKLIDIQLGDILDNDGIKFRIKVRKENVWPYSDDHCTGYTIANRIDYIQIFLEDEMDNVQWATYTASGTTDNYEAILTRQGNPVGKVYTGNKTKRFWMDVKWKNGRLSHFPLYDKFTKWDKIGQDVRNITVELLTKSYDPNYLDSRIDDKIYLDYDE